MFPVGGKEPAQVHIIAIAAQTVTAVGLHLDRALFHFFEDAFIGKDHEYPVF
jgi:hypothetical protein